MRTTLNREDLDQGRVLLSLLPDTLSNIFRTAQLEPHSAGRVSVSYEIAGIGKRRVEASSANEAIRLALIELASVLTSAAAPSEIVRMNASVIHTGREEEANGGSERSLSKVRQQTVGTTLPLNLKEYFNSIASSEATSFAEVCRRFIVFGFDDFVARSLYASPIAMFQMLDKELHEWHGSNTEQVMVRLEPGHAVRLRSAAKEYGKSVSELTVLCAAHGVAMQKLLTSLELKISSCKGAAIRKLVSKLELQPAAAPLVSGVLIGNVRAPRKLLSRLAIVFEAPESLLSTLFRGSFNRRLVPAFKAEAGKPELSTTPARWASAVKSLDLSPDDAKALLDLGV